MEDTLEVVSELVGFACKLTKGTRGKGVLPLVGLLVVTPKDVTVHTGLLSFECSLALGFAGRTRGRSPGVVVVVTAVPAASVTVATATAIVVVRALIVAVWWPLLTTGPVGQSDGGVADGLAHGVMPV